MSNRSNYSIGSGGSSLYSSYYPASGRGKGPVGRKEAEVDRLTDLMVQSMENSSDPEFYGKKVFCYVRLHISFLTIFNSVQLFCL